MSDRTSNSPTLTPTPPSTLTALRRLRERAMDATDVCMVISDPRQPDNPVVWANPAFCRVTGYPLREVLGRNCRILQTAETDPAAVAELRSAVQQGRAVTTTVLNRRRDGSRFWNQLTVSPVFDGGTLVAHVGVQYDVTDRVEAEHGRLRALEDAVQARRTAEHAQTRLQLMAEGTSRLAGTLDTDELLQRLVQLCVPTLAHWAYAVAVSDLGVLTLASPTRPPQGDDVDVATDLGRRAAMAMDNARLYQQEFSVAETLQRSLLPVLPVVPGVTTHAHYQAASSTAAVGGDFYDLIALPDGSIALAIGDVAGHDIDAAAQMGQLRALLRACAHEAPDPDPGAVLDRLDRLVLGLGLGTLATVAYARAERVCGGWRLALASAGHPPLVLCGPDGDVRQLDEVGGLMLGVTTERTRTSATVDVARGTTVLGYTDGLVEHRGADLEDGIHELLELLGALGPSPEPAAITAAAMTLADNRLDDVACISLTLH